MDVQIRWLIRRDMPEVLAMENECFEETPWSEEDFFSLLRQINRIGMVAEHDGQIMGYMIYELHKSNLNVLNFAVGKANQRQGVGRALVEKLTSKLSQHRHFLTLALCEQNLRGQLFFKAMGFTAVRVEKGYYEETNQDAYIFNYDVLVGGSVLEFQNTLIERNKQYADSTAALAKKRAS
mgnify:CR=1 FL=1